MGISMAVWRVAVYRGFLQFQEEGGVMRLIHAICLAAVFAGLAGCAATPVLQGASPALSKDQRYGLGKTEATARTDHLTRHVDENQSIHYYQVEGGGGVTVGLLLGPLGTLANMKMIEGVTSADAEKLKGRLQLSPEAAFQQAALAAEFAVETSAKQGDVKISPVLLISKTNETTLHLSSVLLLEGMEDGKKWERRYQYQLPGRYRLEELTALSEAKAADIQQASVAGYASLLKHLKLETAQGIGKEQNIVFKSLYMSPRNDFEMHGALIGRKDDRVWIRARNGVIAVMRSNIQYQVARN